MVCAFRKDCRLSKALKHHGNCSSNQVRGQFGNVSDTSFGVLEN